MHPGCALLIPHPTPTFWKHKAKLVLTGYSLKGCEMVRSGIGRHRAQVCGTSKTTKTQIVALWDPLWSKQPSKWEEFQVDAVLTIEDLPHSISIRTGSVHSGEWKAEWMYSSPTTTWWKYTSDCKIPLTNWYNLLRDGCCFFVDLKNIALFLNWCFRTEKGGPLTNIFTYKGK